MYDPQKPQSSDEMLEQFRREIESQRPGRPTEPTTPEQQEPRTFDRPRPATAPAPDPPRRPARRPDRPSVPPPVGRHQRRAIFVAAVSLALIVLGLISALVSVQQ